MQKKIVVTTPVGQTQWFNLHKTDKFGSYTCDLILEDSPETHKLKEQIDSMGSGRKPYKVDEQGKLVLKLKLKSQGQKKDGTIYQINPPVVYSKVGAKLSQADLLSMNIGNGSEIKAKIELSAYTFNGMEGVSCKPKAILLKEVNEYGGGEMGFDASEFEMPDESVSEDSGDF